MQHTAMHYWEMSKIKPSKAQGDDKEDDDRSDDDEHNYNANDNGAVAKELQTIRSHKETLCKFHRCSKSTQFMNYIIEIVSSTELISMTILTWIKQDNKFQAAVFIWV